jgi:uncharacterized protein
VTSSDLPPWRQDGSDVVLQLLIQPRASKNQLCGIHEGRLKVRTTSPPVDGAANACCTEFLAKLLKVPKSSIRIEAGETSKIKRLRISGINILQLEQLVMPNQI